MYTGLKLLHVAAVVLFLGNIYTGLYWKLIADRSRDPRIIAHTLEGIIRSDRWFTLPGVVLLIGSGVGAASAGNLRLLQVDWIVWSLALFAASGLVFGLRLVPLQRRLRDLARQADSPETMDWPRYRRFSLAWELWGAFALLTPVAAMALMVLKPGR